MVAPPDRPPRHPEHLISYSQIQVAIRLPLALSLPGSPSYACGIPINFRDVPRSGFARDMKLASHDTNPPPEVDNIRSAIHASYDPREMGNVDKQFVRKWRFLSFF